MAGGPEDAGTGRVPRDREASGPEGPAADRGPKPTRPPSRRVEREVEEVVPGDAPGHPMPGEGMYRSSVGYALWCLFFVGLGGIHRIYLGKYGTGILWLLTAGLFGIGQFVDLFRMNHLVRDANVREGYLPHPRYAHLLPDEPAPSRDGDGRRPPAEDGAPDRDQVMRRLLLAAEERGGAISVTQGVAATGLTFAVVEEVLTDMVASGYVDVDNHPDTGVVIYRFTEL